MYEKTILRITLAWSADNQTVQYDLDLGQNPKEDPITLQGTVFEGEKAAYFTAKVNTLQGENLYTERWDIEMTADGTSRQTVFDFKWEPISGAMELKINDSAEPVSLVFQERENGFYMATSDFSELLKQLTQRDGAPIVNGETYCAMTITKGSQIAKPEYKNLSQWSMEDFLSLVSGIGSLLGINLGN